MIILLGGALDRLLLQMEDRGWINYRKHGISRGAIGYHMLELQSMVNPSAQQIIEVKYREELQEDESGEPPAEGSHLQPPA